MGAPGGKEVKVRAQPPAFSKTIGNTPGGHWGQARAGTPPWMWGARCWGRGGAEDFLGEGTVASGPGEPECARWGGGGAALWRMLYGQSPGGFQVGVACGQSPPTPPQVPPRNVGDRLPASRLTRGNRATVALELSLPSF